MAFRALYPDVSTGQSELGSRVVESLNLLPITCVVTILALGSELPFVLIRVARVTRWRESEESAIQILDPYGCFLDGADVARVMAFRARQSDVLAIEVPAGFRVIELLLRRNPSNEAEVGAVMFRVASTASLAAGFLLNRCCMEAAISG